MYNILIVEDDKPSGLILKKLLTKEGYNITGIYESGEKTLEVIKNVTKPDLVLMDISLSGKIDGIETAEKLFNEYNIPFIYITASSDRDVIERAKKTMPLNYIVKPFNSHTLCSTIEMAMYRYNMESKLSRSTDTLDRIINAIPDFMFEIDREGNPINEADSEVLHKYWSHEHTADVANLLDSAAETHEVQIYEYKLKKDSLKNYEARIIFVETNRFLFIIRDITERKLAEDKIKDHLAGLEADVNSRTEEIQAMNRTMKKEIELRTLAEDEIRVFMELFEQSTRISVIANSEGCITNVNQTFLDLTGLTRSECSEKCLFTANSFIFKNEKMKEQIEKNDIWKGEISNKNKSGETFYLDAIIFKIRNRDGEVTHIALSAEDITQKKIDEEDLKKTRDLLLKSSADSIDKEMDWQTWKEKMLSRNVSRTDKSIFHNINNSFTQGAGFGTLIAFMEMMSSTSVRENDKVIIDSNIFTHAMENVKIAQSAFKIFASIDWVIGNEVELKELKVGDIYKLVKVVIDNCSEMAAINNHRIIINEYPEDIENFSIRINTDYMADSIKEILINAMKFSKHGSTIAVMIYSQNKNLRISTISDPEKNSDDVVGIPIEYEKVVFEPFYRISKLVYEKYHTLDFGIGLTYVEKIVKRHGGEIFAENILDYSDIKKEPIIKVNLMISLPYIFE